MQIHVGVGRCGAAKVGLAGIRFSTLIVLVAVANAAPSQERAVLGHKGSVTCIAFSPDGRLVVAGTTHGIASIVNVSDGTLQATLPKHPLGICAVAFSPDGKTLATSTGDYEGDVIIGYVKLWNVGTWRERSTLRIAGGGSQIAFSPDGRTLVTGEARGGIHLWELATGKERAGFATQASAVPALAFSPDGTILASGSADRKVKLWDLATGRERMTLGEHRRKVAGVAFAPDGKTLASCGWLEEDGLRLWDVATGKELPATKTYAECLAYSPDGKTLALGGANGIRLWDPVAGRKRDVFKVSLDQVLAVAFSPDGKMLAGGCNKGTVRLWDVPPAGQ